MTRHIGPAIVVIVLCVLSILPQQAGAQGPTCGGLAVTIDMSTNGGNGAGTNGPDVILGTPNADVINGREGNDIICAGSGSDTINGGAGNFTDRIYGGPGHDTIYGGYGIDYLYGQAGNDTIDGGGGSDRIYGGDGNDMLKGDSGADRMFGGPGHDTLLGMGGQDLMWGQAGNDTMQGNFQSDNLFGGPGDDILYGAGGKDSLLGEQGNDQLHGGNNTDYIDGGPGTDTANGGNGQDNPVLLPKTRPSGQLYGGSGCVNAETRSRCTPQPIAAHNPGEPTAAPQPTPTPASNGRFETLPVGAALPSGAECAARVRPAPEIRPENAAANANQGSRANANNRTDWAGFDRVDGNFAGTTDEIIQWAACKWGIDEDIVRAQVIKESYWRQSTNGDNGESWGLGQIKEAHHQTAFEYSINARTSSAYNLDYTYASWRACYEGVYDWLNHTDKRTGDYGQGDVWGCLGVWYSGLWYWNNDHYLFTATYSLQFHYQNRTWETQTFIDA